MPNLDRPSPPTRRNARPKARPRQAAMHYIRGAAAIALFIATLKFIEALVAPPMDDTPRWLVAAVVTFKFWAAGLALGLIAGAGWVSHRLFGWPAAPRPSALVPTRHVIPDEVMRLRSWGFNIVAGWFCLGILALIVMADTRTGPFARAATALFGPGGLIWLETFALGIPAVIAPLLLLAWLPWQTQFPLLSSMQNVVKLSAQPQARRPKRGSQA